MPFVKLDCGLLDSTLWFERDAREIFITALLLASPQEFTEPIPEIEIDSLTYTGWSAPPGWYGYVPAAGPGIIRRALLDQDEGKEGLRKLAAADPNSRSQEFEGRRMIRINGGYLILNYQRYREKDHTSAERSRRYREKRHAVSSHSHAVSSRSVTQAEAEAEAEAEADPSQSPVPLHQENTGLTPSRAGVVIPRQQPSAPVKFVPPQYETVAAYMISKGFANAPTEAVKFVAHYDSNGWKVGRNPMKSWKGAAAGWILRKEEYS